MDKKIMYIFGHSIEPQGISGSETILIETFKRISKSFKEVILFTWKPGFSFYNNLGLTDITFRVSSLPVISNFNISFFLRCVYGLWLGLTFKIPDPQNTYLYPGSDFWPDSIPAILLKKRYPKTTLLATFYLTAPNPFFGFQEGKSKLTIPSLNNIFYWLMQKPVFNSFKKRADAVIVTSQPDKLKFPNHQVFIIKGGVDVSSIEKYIQSHSQQQKIYDAVFMGRFHPQKGVLELIDIWTQVVKKLPSATLVMIGDGPLFSQVKEKIVQLHLEKNITLTGSILEKEKRYELFQQSKIVVHPAIYDSGGMAAAEAMTFRLPAISFDLEALKTYYPKGMQKVEIHNFHAFAEAIIYLLQDTSSYNHLAAEAQDLVYNHWNWDMRAKEFMDFLQKLKR